MDNFFDKNLLQSLISGLVIMFVGFLFANRTASKTGSGKFWKAVVVLSVIAMIGGFYLFITFFSENGFSIIYTGVGLSLLVLGYVFNKLGKFLNWWNN